MSSARYIVSGMVQGVGFRWFVARQAQRLAIRGWVANLPDGTVEVVAAGSDAALARLEHELKRGPPAAKVARVEKSDVSDDIDQINSFRIR